MSDRYLSLTTLVGRGASRGGRGGRGGRARTAARACLFGGKATKKGATARRGWRGGRGRGTGARGNEAKGINRLCAFFCWYGLELCIHCLLSAISLLFSRLFIKSISSPFLTIDRPSLSDCLAQAPAAALSPKQRHCCCCPRCHHIPCI